MTEIDGSSPGWSSPMNQIRSIQKLNKTELARGILDSGSWHDQYKSSPFIFIGGLPFDLTEGDILTIFSQYGEIREVHLVRDKDTGKSRGFAFLEYVDQRSTVLAVDNFNGIKVLGRVLRVDHTLNYKPPKDKAAEESRREREKESRIAEMADEIFQSAVGNLFAVPADYDQKQMLMSPAASVHGQHGEEVENPEEIEALLARERKRQLKALRRERETAEERMQRKSKNKN